MTVYQIVNEQNHPIYAFFSLETAAQEVQMLNESHDDHVYFVNEVKLEVVK